MFIDTGPDISVRECMRCHHRWVPRQTRPPRQCPNCHSPYWQTERQNTKRGRPTKVQVLWSDDKIKTHRAWGRWRLNNHPPYPTLDFPIRAGYTYEIKLSRCNTPLSRELWLQQMTTKRFITSADLGDLVRAFFDLMRQGEISVGSDK